MRTPLSQTTRLIALGLAFGAPGITTAAGGAPGAAVPGPAAAAAAGASRQPPALPSRDEYPRFGNFWLDLSEPALSSVGYDRPAERVDLLARIDRQQDEVLERVRELGGEELARVKEVRNAVAVTLPATAVPAVGRIRGVLRVRPVQHRNRIGD
jgi:hypothetical protein